MTVDEGGEPDAGGSEPDGAGAPVQGRLPGLGGDLPVPPRVPAPGSGDGSGVARGPAPPPGVVAGGEETPASLARVFRDFADDPMRDLPLYRRLCTGASEDLEVAGRLLLARPGQRLPILLLAAVHDVLLAGADDPLAAWYGSVTEHPMAVGGGGNDPWPHFRRLALEDDDVAERLRTRATQTNEVGRCAALLPALVSVAADAPGSTPGGLRPLGLVEVGASAGLNLLLDHYGYHYEPDGTEVNPSAALVLSCRFRGPGRPALVPDPPTIATRAGIDPHPIDLGDRDAARWLVACQWPEQPERIHRVRTALAMAHGHKPRIVRGDAVDDLGALVEAVPDHALPVVVSTWVLPYLPEERRRAFADRLDELGAHRDLSFVGSELPSWIPGFPVPARPDGKVDGPATALFRLDWRGGVRSGVRLADQHPHGAWLEWLAS